MTYSFISRSRIVLGVIFLFSLVLVGKVFLLQIVHGDTYAEAATRQYSTPSGNIYERGTIFFQKRGRGGDFQLISAATQATGFKITINPTKITDAEELYKKLNKIVALDHEDFIWKATRVNDPYEEVASKVSKEEADAIALLKLNGVSIFKEKWRLYPSGSLASHVLGLVAYKDNDLGGRYGLERKFDIELSRNNNSPYVNFFAEVFSNISKTFFDEVGEGDVVTTIESTVQSFLEKKLEEVKDKYRVDAVGGIIMDPRDGSIYAMAAKPDFNPNDFSQVEDISVFSNPLVENVLEFGSVVKPLVMAAALDAGLVTAGTIYDDKGMVVVEKKEIYNFDKVGRGPNTTMQDVLNQSLNTGMVFVEQKLGKDRLREYLFSYGIKEKSGIDLPNETGALISNLYTPRELEYANAAFGQGIAMSPILMIRALATLANGGNLVVPHLVEEIKYNIGTSRKIAYPIKRSKISPETSEEITRMLVTVMDEAIGGGRSKLEHFSVAVKTGTAQVADNVSGGYYEDRHTHSFVGYFPAYDPQFIILLYAVNPKDVQYAATTWSTPFLDITKFLLNYYEVPPDR